MTDANISESVQKLEATIRSTVNRKPRALYLDHIVHPGVGCAHSSQPNHDMAPSENTDYGQVLKQVREKIHLVMENGEP